MPAELAFVISTEDKERLAKYRGHVLSSVFDNEERFDLKGVEVLNSYSARFADASDGRQALAILGYGDFNDDGVEDILLLVHNFITTASYSTSTLYQLTRYDNGALKLLHEYPLPGR